MCNSFVSFAKTTEKPHVLLAETCHDNVSTMPCFFTCIIRFYCETKKIVTLKHRVLCAIAAAYKYVCAINRIEQEASSSFFFPTDVIRVITTANSATIITETYKHNIPSPYIYSHICLFGEAPFRLLLVSRILDRNVN